MRQPRSNFTDLQGGTTSFEDRKVFDLPWTKVQVRGFSSGLPRARASFGTVLVMNSQEFMDTPRGPKSERRVHNLDLPFHGSGRFPRGRSLMGRAATSPGLEGVGLGFRMEWRFFGVPGPFHGARGFSPLRTSLPSQLNLLSGSTRERIGIARSINLRCSPLISPDPISYEIGGSGNPMFSEKLSGGSGVPRMTSRSSLGQASREAKPGSTDGLDCSGSPEGGRIPPGGYPSPGWPSIAGRGLPASRHSLVHEAARRSLREASVKSVGLRLRMFPFQGCPQLPFHPVHWPPGSLGGGVPVLRGSPSWKDPPSTIPGRGLAFRIPIYRSTGGREFP